jgi:6-phosphogluconolactonase
MASESLLRPLSIEPQNIFRWPTETGDVAIAAEEYQVVLENAGPLDLVLLGLGADAHTASLFPRSDALRETKRLAVANRVEKLDTYRLTMTFPEINDAESTIFLVSGSDKAEAVKGVIEGEFNPDKYPAQGVLPISGRLYWLLDEEAARFLESR